LACRPLDSSGAKKIQGTFTDVEQPLPFKMLAPTLLFNDPKRLSIVIATHKETTVATGYDRGECFSTLGNLCSCCDSSSALPALPAACCSAG
jgi:hypothetical protein